MFLAVTFGLPLVALVLGTFSGALGVTAGRGLATAFELGASDDSGPSITIGYVDDGRFVRTEPPGARYVRFADEAAARSAVLRGAVQTAYILPSDYPENREVVRWSTGLQVRGNDHLAFRQLLRANLWPQASPDQLADLAIPGRRVDLALDLARYRLARGSLISILLPITLGVLLYTTIFTVSSYLLQGLTTEKENRVLEILLTSTRPSSLLGGKLLGLGALGLLQMLVWSLLGGALAGGIAAAATAAGLQVGGTVLIVAALYFVLGYFFYACLMAAVGALAPSFKESSALTFVVLFPAWIPFFAVEALLAEPNGSAARLFTYFPPTAPLVGVMRAVSGPVPPVEVAVSLAILALAGAAVLWAATRLFTAGILLSGGVPSPTMVAAALLRR